MEKYKPWKKNEKNEANNELDREKRLFKEGTDEESNEAIVKKNETKDRKGQ